MLNLRFRTKLYLSDDQVQVSVLAVKKYSEMSIKSYKLKITFEFNSSAMGWCVRHDSTFLIEFESSFGLNVV